MTVDPSRLTHLNDQGAVQMVDITQKNPSLRIARAQAEVHMLPETLVLLQAGNMKKGDVLAVARVAAIQAAKRTSELIPLAHPISLQSVQVTIEFASEGCVRIVVEARTTGETGVEMEALTAAAAGALTIYDMIKGVERGVKIERVMLLEKTGGRSDWKRMG